MSRPALFPFDEPGCQTYLQGDEVVLTMPQSLEAKYVGPVRYRAPDNRIEGRYAGALYSAASQMKQLDAAEEHLVKFLEELNTKQRMKDFVESVDISRAAKAEALKYVGEKTGMPSSASNFLALVAENGRLKQLRKMIGLFLSVMVAHRSEVPCEVVTAKALDADTKKALLDALAQHVQGKKIMLVERVNPDIIGGMIVAIDDKVVDMSVSRKMQMYINLLKQLNHALWGASPRWWHACNAALHAACCALVARACLTVARLQRPFAALAAVLFAAHPVHTEAVSGVVGRADVLACFFFLSSMLVYHGSGGASAGRHCVWGSVLLAALSMLAKETGVTVLLLNLAFDLYRSWPSFRKTQSGIRWNKKNSRLLVRASKLLVSLVLLLSVRLALLQGSLPTFSQQDNPAAFHPSLLVRFMTFCYLAAFNWWLLLCPWTLSHDWQMGSVPLVASLADSRNLLTCAALGALLLLAYRCFTDLEAQRHAPAVLGLLLLVVPFVPAANVFVTVGFVVAERVLYIPSVGSVLITAYGAQLMWRARAPRRLVLLGVGVLVVSSALRTQQRNRDWRTKDTLLRADLATLPHNAKLHYNYANFLRDSENQENAIHHYKEALRLWPSYASAHNNLGTLIVGTGKAEYHFLQAIKYSRDHVNAHFNLGKLYRKNNKTADAARLLERCVVLAPRFSQAYVELLLMRPQRERGPLLRQVLALEPRNSEHHVMYGKWLRVHGLRAPAMKHFLQAMRISFQAKDSERGSKPDLLALRAAVLEMRELGQKSRILQLLTRWHTWRRGWQSAAASHVYLREWRLRLELTRRARAYARLQHAPPAAVTKTCLDHKQLDISSPEFSKDSQFRQDPHAETEHLEQVASLHTNHNTTQNTTTSEDLESREDLKTKGGCSEGDCRPERRFGGKKRALSVPASYKPTHNESEDGHKRSCSTLHKKDRGKLKKPKATISPFITDHLMQTF